MPRSSTIPRSSSDPFISSAATTVSSSSSSKATSNHRHHHRQVLRFSTRSARSARSSSSSNIKSAYWLAWSNINKLGTLLIPGRKSTDSSSRHSDLTEESLVAHNKRQEAILRSSSADVEDKNAKCSPYYKGLIDSSLAVNREKHLHDHHHQLPLPTLPSPGRESHATVATSTSSLSSFVHKMQEWGSWIPFSLKSTSTITTTTNNNKNSVFAPSLPAPPTDTVNPSRPKSSSSSLSSVPASARITAKRTETLTDDNHHLVNAASSSVLVVKNNHHKDDDDAKPLRERVSETSSKPPSPIPSHNEGTSGDSNISRRNSNNMIIINYEEKKDSTAAAAAATVPVDMLPGKNFMWANKYRPKSLKEFICNRDKTTQLQALIRGVDCGHFIFEGPAGVGKRTMIWAMLQEACGPDKVQTREECKAFNLKGEQVDSISVRLKVSSQHVEVNLSDLKGYEKHVIVELIKETRKSVSNKKKLQPKFDTCRAIILYDADKLSTDALLYIKWLLEKYKGFSKFFFCCCDVSKLQPVRSLCTLVQLSPPSNNEIVEVLEFIAKREGIALPRRVAEKIAGNSKNNLRQAIRSFEASWQKSHHLTEAAILTGWEDDIVNIAKNILQEQSPKQLYMIRGKLQNLVEHDVSPDFIFESLVGELKKHLAEPFQLQIDTLYRNYSRRNDENMLDGENQMLFPGSRHEEAAGKRLHDTPCRKKLEQFMRIEEFIAKFMSFCKSSVNHSMS